MFKYSKGKMWAVYWLSVLSLFVMPITWTTLIAFICFQGLGIVVTYHRYYAHKSFEFKHPPLKWILSYFAMMGGQGSPMIWTATHRMHHRYADTEKDPHSPTHGFLRSFLVPTFEPWDLRMVASMSRDKRQVMLQNYYFLIILVSWFISYLIGLPQVIQGTALAFLCTNVGNYLGHMIGYKNFETKSLDTNHWFVALIFFGDGWHNNHHHNPSRFTTQVKWWEFDIAGFVIKHLLADKTTLK